MSMIVDLNPSIKYISLIENIFISCSKLDSFIGTRKRKYAIVKVYFQSHNHSYLPCSVLLNFYVFKTSWKYPGKYSAKIWNLSLLVTFSSFWSSPGHILITNDNPVQKHNPAHLASEFLKLIFWDHRDGLNSNVYYGRSIYWVIKF